MRTNIDIDNELMAEAMKAGRLKTKKETVDAALRAFIGYADQVNALQALRGLGWKGDLADMRNDWNEDVDRG